MIEAKQKLRDPGREMQLLGTIFKNGQDAYIDSSAILDSNDFTSSINRVIYTSMKYLADDPNFSGYNIENIKLQADKLGFKDTFKDKKSCEYLENLEFVNLNKDDISLFSYHVKKLSHVRQMHDRYIKAISYLENINGEEKLSDIIKCTEENVLDYTNNIHENKLESLSENIEQYIQQSMDNPIIQEVGVPTGFPIYDDLIGNIRKAGVNIIASRSGKGKSFLALNIARNIALSGKRVLYLDTEMNLQSQQLRLLCIDSLCPLSKFETGEFKEYKELRDAVAESGKRLKDIPFDYQSVAGMSHVEILSIARRWLVKNVKVNNQGQYNDCIILYDYFKLMSSDQIKNNLAEFQILGFIITDTHNFAQKYNVPVLAFAQQNRDGINNTDSGTLALSDRLLWLTSSLSFLIDKTNADIEMGSTFSFGNKKLLINKARNSSSMETEGDYINIKASINPNVAKSEATGRFTEGFLHSQIMGGHV